MKAIFLDIDGVLNSANFVKAEYEVGRGGGLIGIDPKAIKLLEELIELSDARIVISSSWRIGRTLEELKQIFRNVNFKYVDNIVGATSTKNEFGNEYRPRGWQIEKYLFEHPEFKHAVILDDDSDMDSLMFLLVQTTFESGLQSEHITECLEKLEIKL